MIVETWRILAFTVTDGDTIRVFRARSVVGETRPIGGFLMSTLTVFHTDPDVHPRGEALRLVTLDTPERGEVGWADAREDLAAWLAQRAPDSLMVDVYPKAPGGGLGRLLGDVYVEGDRSATASRHMLQERGWDPWVS